MHNHIWFNEKTNILYEIGYTDIYLHIVRVCNNNISISLIWLSTQYQSEIAQIHPTIIEIHT